MFIMYNFYFKKVKNIKIIFLMHYEFNININMIRHYRISDVYLKI